MTGPNVGVVVGANTNWQWSSGPSHPTSNTSLAASICVNVSDTNGHECDACGTIVDTPEALSPDHDKVQCATCGVEYRKCSPEQHIRHLTCNDCGVIYLECDTIAQSRHKEITCEENVRYNNGRGIYLTRQCGYTYYLCDPDGCDNAPNHLITGACGHRYPRKDANDHRHWDCGHNGIYACDTNGHRWIVCGTPLQQGGAADCTALRYECDSYDRHDANGNIISNPPNSSNSGTENCDGCGDPYDEENLGTHVARLCTQRGPNGQTCTNLIWDCAQAQHEHSW